MTANIQQAPHFIYLFIYIIAVLLLLQLKSSNIT